jgi:signal transduction histidine kinase
VLERADLPDLPRSLQPELVELESGNGESLIVSYAPIERSSFRLVLLRSSSALPAEWLTLRRDLGLFLLISILLILGVIVTGSIYMIRKLKEADRLRALMYHKMEYTNKMESLGRMSAGVAHEINNPLSIITEKAGLMKDLLELSSEVPPREKLISLVNSVLNSADRCGGITHRLLGFARHMQVQREKIDLDLMLREVLGFLEKEAEYRQITVDFTLPEEQVTINSDRGQLQQVFLNLLNNAFAAVDDGGHIEIGVRHLEDNMVTVSVADNGSGIPEENLNRIFDPFFTTKKGAGTGLGLSITYGIIEKLGGRISVESTVGEGTCFTVTLPLDQNFNQE